jgi:hypothetical protein
LSLQIHLYSKSEVKSARRTGRIPRICHRICVTPERQIFIKTPIRSVNEDRLPVLTHFSALLADTMFVTRLVSVKLQYFSNYLPSTEVNDFIFRDDVTGDKIIIRTISYIANADIIIIIIIIIMGERTPRLRQLDAVRQEMLDVMYSSQLTAVLYALLNSNNAIISKGIRSMFKWDISL